MLQPEFEQRFADLTREMSALESETVDSVLHKQLAEIRRRLEILFEMLMARIRLFETILENSADPIYAKDRDSVYTYLNPAFETEFLNRTFKTEFDLKREHAVGKTDYDIFPVANAEEYRSNDKIAMTTGEMREHETWWNNKIYLTRKMPLTSPGGEIRGICCLSVDITEYRMTELALQDAVKSLERERENKMMNIDAVLASIAHELRQPLQGIAANGSAARRFLKKAPPDTDKAQKCLDDIVSDCGRANEMFDGIRALFRRGEQARQPVDVNEIALEVLQLMRGELREHSVTTHAELSPSLPLILADRSQLQQLIYNLAQNAIEAMASNTGRSRELRVKTELQDRNAIILTVEDSGPGIDPKRLGGIFDAFVTTMANGIGLGLAICRMIVERHDGQLTVLSDGRSGASFRVALPINSSDRSGAGPH